MVLGKLPVPGHCKFTPSFHPTTPNALWNFAKNVLLFTLMHLVLLRNLKLTINKSHISLDKMNSSNSLVLMSKNKWIYLCFI